MMCLKMKLFFSEVHVKKERDKVKKLRYDVYALTRKGAAYFIRIILCVNKSKVCIKRNFTKKENHYEC